MNIDEKTIDEMSGHHQELYKRCMVGEVEFENFFCFKMLPHGVQQFTAGATTTDPLFHSDTIHHVEFDFYGQRVVTVSSDKLVCIWDKNAQGTWRRTASWKKHGGAVWRARFAHPEFGQVLATCSFDNTIQIFDKDAVGVMDARSSLSSSDESNGWVCRTVLRQSTASITDIQFAPHYLGLQLAACTSSGRVVIYEAEDIMALDNWNVLVDSEVAQHRLCSISWSTNRFDPPYIALSSDDADSPADEKVFLFRVANTGIIRARVLPPQSGSATNSPDNIFGVGSREEDGSSKQQQIEKQQIPPRPINTKFHQFLFDDPVSMIAFGPSCGLSIHKLAIATETRLLVYQLQLVEEIDAFDSSNSNNEENVNNISAESGEETRGGTRSVNSNPPTTPTSPQSHQGDFGIKALDVLAEGNSQLVRFAWNVLGDVISAVYADGLVRIWRYTFTSRWSSVSTIVPPPEKERNTEDVYY